MAKARLRRFAWPAAGVVAAMLLAPVAVQGEQPQSGLMRFAPAGVLADWTIRDVSEVTVSTNATAGAFHRGAAEEWRAANTNAALPPQMAERIEIGLTLLHNSSSERILGQVKWRAGRLANSVSPRRA